jgi:hypothetical protein
MEEFKDIIRYEGLYQVSNLGRVKSLRRNKILSPSKECGYLKTTLRKDGKQRKLAIHQLVAMAFLGHEPCGHELVVNHINKNKLDNRVENLKIKSIKNKIKS